MKQNSSLPYNPENLWDIAPKKSKGLNIPKLFTIKLKIEKQTWTKLQKWFKF